MAMSIASGADSDPIADMNTTPLIDVMLVLLIMFIITLPIMTHNTPIEMPRGGPPPLPRDAVEVAIEFDGTILWNGAVVESFDQLERYLRSEAARPQQAELHLRPDRRAKYDVVAKVLSTAQRSGLQRIGFAGQEQYLE
ncbi:MAG: ExbD/TolR family protein [Steroidobacteraceae bacterium]